MRQTMSLALLVLSALVALSLAAPAAPGAEPVGVAGGDLGSALDYLQKLDRYYSQVARPRYQLERQRREDVASALMKLSQIRQHYSDLGRPRFGKRSGFGQEYALPVRASAEDY